MAENNNICKEHSGCMARIEGVEEEVKSQWNMITRIETRMNQIFGAIIITLIAALANLLIRLGVRL